MTRNAMWHRCSMDEPSSTAPGRHPIFTPEHDALRASVRRWVEAELVPNVEEWEDAEYFSDDVFRRAGALGFLGLHYPTKWGGSGGDRRIGARERRNSKASSPAARAPR